MGIIGSLSVKLHFHETNCNLAQFRRQLQSVEFLANSCIDLHSHTCFPQQCLTYFRNQKKQDYLKKLASIDKQISLRSFGS